MRDDTLTLPPRHNQHDPILSPAFTNLKPATDL
jgi:hypothetical protein